MPEVEAKARGSQRGRRDKAFVALLLLLAGLATYVAYELLVVAGANQAKMEQGQVDGQVVSVTLRGQELTDGKWKTHGTGMKNARSQVKVTFQTTVGDQQEEPVLEFDWLTYNEDPKAWEAGTVHNLYYLYDEGEQVYRFGLHKTPYSAGANYVLYTLLGTYIFLGLAFLLYFSSPRQADATTAAIPKESGKTSR